MARAFDLPASRRLLLAWLLAGSLHCPAAFAQTLSITPGPTVLEDEPVVIEAQGLSPGEEVEIYARRWYTDSPRRPLRRWQSQVRLRADATGRINLANLAPLSGSYEGADPFGLFWSMAPLPGQAPVPEDVDDRRIDIELARANGQALKATFRLLPSLPQVETHEVPGLPGAVYARLPGPQARPGLIVLGASEGDDGIAEAAAPFASQGFAVLALPYFSPPDESGTRKFPTLPPGVLELPVEVLDAGHAWLASQPGVDPERMAIHGTSVDSTLALLGAVHLP